MPKIIKIDDLNNEMLAPYISMKSRDFHGAPIFIAESKRVVGALLKHDFKIISVLTCQSALKSISKYLKQPRFSELPVLVAEGAVLTGIVGFRFHQGIMAAVQMPPEKRIEDIELPKGKRHFIMALNGVSDPQNVGLLSRCAAAFGVDAIMVDKNCCNPYYRKCVRVSIGGILDIPVAHEKSLPVKLKWLKKKYGTRILIASPSADSSPLSRASLKGNICVVMGSEGKGVDKAVERLADDKIRIPMYDDKVDSLNVACAGAILLHAAYAKRK